MDRLAALLFAADAPPPQPQDFGELPDARGRYTYEYLGQRDGRHRWRVVPADAPASMPVRRREVTYYDPARATIGPHPFDPDSQWVTTRGTQFVDPSTTSHRNEHVDYLDVPPGMLWRGMSAEEYQEARQRGYFESKGEHNLGDEQIGQTFFSTLPSSAANYASGFAPWQYKPTFTRPAYVVGIPDRPDAPRGPLGDDPSSHEVGLSGRIPFSEVQHTYVGRPHEIAPGEIEVSEDLGSPTGWSRPVVNHPSPNLRWEPLAPDHEIGDPTSDPPSPCTPSNPAPTSAKPERRGRPAGSRAHFLQLLPQAHSTIAQRRPLRQARALFGALAYDPAYFSGVHEMGHVLDLAGQTNDEGSQTKSRARILNELLKVYHRSGGDPNRDATHPSFQGWLRQQLPGGAFQGNVGQGEPGAFNLAEGLAHGFTEAELNPAANEVAKTIHRVLLEDAGPPRPNARPRDTQRGLPPEFLRAVDEMQAKYPRAELDMVGIDPDEYDDGPAFTTPGMPGHRPLLFWDNHYRTDDPKLEPWIHKRVEQGYFPQWLVTSDDPPPTPPAPPKPKVKAPTVVPDVASRLLGMALPDGYTVRRKSDPGSDPGVDLFEPGGRDVGGLNWYADNDEISMIDIDPDYRRRGLATELFDHVKGLNPNLQHSDELTPDGAAWAGSLGWNPSPGGDDSVFGIQESERTAAALFGAIFPPHDEGVYLDPRQTREAPANATWYHVSPEKLEPGARLRPFGGPRNYGQAYDRVPDYKHRDQHVWTEYHAPNAENWATGRAKYIYEITPDETPQAWNGTAQEGWVTPGATVTRQISDNGWLPMNFNDGSAPDPYEFLSDPGGEMPFQASRAAAVEVFADPDGSGVWKTSTRNGVRHVEFLARP